VIIHDLDVVSITLAPYETHPPLVIDPNAMLALAVTAELLQVVSRRRPQVLYRLSIVQHRELTLRPALDTLEARTALAVEERFRVLAPEPFDHEPNRYYVLRKMSRM
jgi:hypothetical protein